MDKRYCRACGTELEVKSYIYTTTIFGEKSGDSRASGSGLAHAFEQRRTFLPLGARYILFAFGLYSGYPDAKVIARLKEICCSYAVILREEPKVERERGKERWVYNFDNSVSELIKYLRNLS